MPIQVGYLFVPRKNQRTDHFLKKRILLCMNFLRFLAIKAKLCFNIFFHMLLWIPNRLSHKKTQCHLHFSLLSARDVSGPQRLMMFIASFFQFHLCHYYLCENVVFPPWLLLFSFLAILEVFCQVLFFSPIPSSIVSSFGSFVREKKLLNFFPLVICTEAPPNRQQTKKKQLPITMKA